MHVENAFKGSQLHIIAFPFFGRGSHKLKCCRGNEENVVIFSLKFTVTNSNSYIPTPSDPSLGLNIVL